MSRYVCYYSARKGFYRELASRWSKWAATADLSELEKVGTAKFFGSIARRFGLTKEFRALGVI